MILAIDFDETWTQDPEAWEETVIFFKRRGHTVILVTNRPDHPLFREDVEVMAGPYVDALVFAGQHPKEKAAKQRGYDVDVWIDDSPNTVVQGRKLAFF